MRDQIKAADSWAHPQRSVWFVDTKLSCARWRDDLKSVGDANDSYFVVKLEKHWASSNTDKDVTDWLKSTSRNSS